MGIAWLTGENKKFSKILRGQTCEQFFHRGDTMKIDRRWYKIQRSELTNTRLTQKRRSSWVTFKCQKCLWNISLAIKESLSIENGTQYTNCQINNSIKIQIYSKVSHNTSLWTDRTIVSMSLRLMFLLTYDIRNEQMSKTSNISWHSSCLTAHSWGLKFCL